MRVASEIASDCAKLHKPYEIGGLYLSKFVEIASSILDIEAGKEARVSNGSIGSLAREIIETGSEDGGFWAGDLNYSLTRMIQLVPKKLAEKGKWEREFRYWTYAVTAGALERAAFEINARSREDERSEWILTALVGTLIDVKDEYKRRVNAAYEEEQIKLNGDCYEVNYSTSRA
jgi:hypothetical protein